MDTEGSSRIADIFTFDSRSDRCFILNPTIRYETDDPEQAVKIIAEKRGIYEAYTGYLQVKYRDRFGDKRFEVADL